MKKFIILAGVFFLIQAGIVLLIEGFPSLWKFYIWQLGHISSFLGAICLIIAGVKMNSIDKIK